MFRRPLHVIIVGSIRGKGCEAVAGASGLVISKDFINIDLIFRIDIDIRVLTAAYGPFNRFLKVPNMLSSRILCPKTKVFRSDQSAEASQSMKIHPAFTLSPSKECFR